MNRLNPDTEGQQYLTEEPSRLQFAAECRREGGTVYSIARRLKRDPGSLEGMAKNMAVAGVLVASNSKKGQRNVTSYAFNSDWSVVLDECLAVVEPGALQAGAEFLLVSVDALEGLARVLASQQAERAILWMAELNDSTFGALLAARPDQTTRLLLTLQGHGRVARSAVKSVFANSELRDWAEAALVPFSDKVAEIEP